MVYPIIYRNNRVSTIQGDAAFLPSTVVYKKMSVGCWPSVGSVDRNSWDGAVVLGFIGIQKNHFWLHFS